MFKSVTLNIYYSNGELRSIITPRGFRLYLKKFGLIATFWSILKSMFRGSQVIRIREINEKTLFTLIGIKSLRQKELIFQREGTNLVIAKKPLGNLAIMALEIELRGLDFFTSIGIRTMRIYDADEYKYYVEFGDNKYMPCLAKDFCDKLMTLFSEEECPSHGDFTVWNTLVIEGELVLLDLERFNLRRPVYYDFCYYIFSYAIFIKKFRKRNLLKFLRNELKLYDIPISAFTNFINHYKIEREEEDRLMPSNYLERVMVDDQVNWLKRFL